MARFLQYLNLKEYPLEDRVSHAFHKYGVSSEQRDDILAFLEPIIVKDGPTYEHSLRVGLLAGKIGEWVNLDSRAMYYAGLLHDIGKCQTPLSTLQKTEGWTATDTEIMTSHVMDGYRMICDKFKFSADIIVWHHRFQKNPYPAEMPTPSANYNETNKLIIPECGRLLALADTFDALHRVNNKNGQKALDGEQIKEIMLAHNTDRPILVRQLFEAGIFTTKIF